MNKPPGLFSASPFLTGNCANIDFTFTEEESVGYVWPLLFVA